MDSEQILDQLLLNALVAQQQEPLLTVPPVISGHQLKLKNDIKNRRKFRDAYFRQLLFR